MTACHPSFSVGRVQNSNSGTTVGHFDERSVEAYAAAGVDRLVVLPKLHATHAERHTPVALDEILRNIETVAKIVGNCA